MTREPVLIAGGGIGGAAAALALARQGWPVRVLEQLREFGEIGAGIQLGPNVYKILETLGLTGAIDATAVRPDALVMRDALDGEIVTRVPLTMPASPNLFLIPTLSRTEPICTPHLSLPALPNQKSSSRSPPR